MNNLYLCIVLGVILLGFLYHIVMHLLAIFCPHVTKVAVEVVMKDPTKHVVYEHMLYFLRNMIGFFIALMLFVEACNGHVKVTKTENSTEISVNRK